MSHLLTPDEAASKLKIAKNTLRNWRVQGTGPRFAKLGNRSVRYRAEDLEAWVEAGLA